MALFSDRRDAGRDLSASLREWMGTDAVVVGIPRGGVVVADAVARELALPLAAVVVRKLGAPGREEYAVGAIAAGVRVVDDVAVRAQRISAAQLAGVESRERAELERRAELFARGADVGGRVAIVVDDGLATGATAIAACRAVRAMGASSVVLAVPVAPASWRPGPGLVEAYVCPHRPPEFWAVGGFYDDFHQTGDAEVVRLLAGEEPDEHDGGGALSSA